VRIIFYFPSYLMIIIRLVTLPSECNSLSYGPERWAGFTFRYWHISTCPDIHLLSLYFIQVVTILSYYTSVYSCEHPYVVFLETDFNIATYRCYKSLIITGFGLNLLTLLLKLHFQLQTLITAHNRWLPNARYFSSWTTNVFPSTVAR
jgi:hypothetical protein